MSFGLTKGFISCWSFKLEYKLRECPRHSTDNPNYEKEGNRAQGQNIPQCSNREAHYNDLHLYGAYYLVLGITEVTKNLGVLYSSNNLENITISVRNSTR